MSQVAICRVVLSESVDGCICFKQKIQHGRDWERSRHQGLKNVYNFLMTVRPLMSWACGHRTEMLLILKKLVLTWLLTDIFWSDSPKKCPTICTRSIFGWTLFQPLGLRWICADLNIIVRYVLIKLKVGSADSKADLNIIMVEWVEKIGVVVKLLILLRR